ncbi:RNA 2',3'-cyclic phosphodiesterase [Sphingomicrobium sediminis]|uniref:RNA 2',3'-cyclic phosphodiesterase n=1 Tax=Sphingomicrobium sediminis TaxID=2950949 RepID=A0A9X2EF42_9SPHN|nr:RNA 2',3'-cyclic phosphodiesterase [Sphingomicrobium sediminis]MCM8556387.1 RNA 2',3'-cyclic phosphodiesterase [Sphingomicrobium sediminis]
MHRLFVALPLPETLVDALAPAMEGGPSGLRWLDEEHLHCTLRFIGSVERPMAEEIAQNLAEMKASPVEVALSGVGIFDHGKRGALWARLAPKAPLRDLHERIDRRLVSLGLEPERRAYLPHITLARWSGGFIDARGWAERHAGLSSSPVTIDRFTLFESHLRQSGAEYDAIADFRLGRQPSA